MRFKTSDESPSGLEYAINHVFLPPRLPQTDDASLENELFLAKSLYKSLLGFRKLEPASSEALNPALDMVGHFSKAEHITPPIIRAMICGLSNGDHIVFYLRAQNAALFVTRKAEDILFEAFELLPPNSRVMSCRGSLLREFPECAALVKLHVVSSEAFLSVFIEVMTKLELDIAPNAQPKAKKGGVEHAEERDTMSPFLVTGMVMDVLAGLGCRVQPSRYIKRSREQVDWSNARLPFHRSPVWLLLRVSLRLALEHGQILSNEWSSPGVLYKALLAFHHCRLLQDATRRGFGSEVLYCMGAKVARRVLKLDPPCQSPWLREAMTAVEAARLVLQGRWEKVQESDNTQLPLERFFVCAIFETTCPGWTREPLPGELSKSYQDIPEALSVMFLTIMELWVALDDIAGRAVKLLLNYDPGLTPDLLQPLLLSTKRQMQRLQAVEQYLVCRQQRAGGSYPSAFSNFGDPYSLAVRYVHSSCSHQALLEEITAKAERDKAAKIREYEAMRNLYDSYVRERNRMDHNDNRDRWGDMTHQPNSCSRCLLDDQIKSMRISVFEWPLPADDNHAMATVFEIDVDKTVWLWRSATMELLTKVFRGEAVKRTSTKLWWAGSHSGLQRYVKRTNESHYRDQHISQATRQNELCHDLIMQACLEAGAPGATRHVLRMAHADAGCERYAGKATKALREALLRVQDSWQNETTLCLIARLSARLFSLSPSKGVSDEILELLAAIRKVSIGWVRELVRKLDENVSVSHRDSLSRRILMSSLICAITFDVGAEPLHSVLNSGDNLSIYTEVAASVHDHLPGDGVPSERIPRCLFDRWQRISHLSYTTVTEEVIFWSEYAPSRSGWQVDELPRGHVLVSNTDTPDGPMTVSFNLLKGLVLVNGHPLARLPESYQTHPTFIQLFGRQILDVMPSAIPEMQFSARRDQMGWGVHFAMTDGKLVIRAISRDISPLGNASPTMWEYIPCEYLKEDLPATFVKRYSHWMNLSNQVIQFRPVQQPWMSVPDSWALSSGILSKGVCRVIDPYSNTAEQILKIMEPLESKYNIDCIFNSNVDSLEVELPRFSLSFTLAREDSVLKSKNYPGMCVKKSQGIGTLIGLKSKLVLGPAEPSSTRPKTVLIPQGGFSPRIAGDHVEVLAHPSSKNRIRHHIFEANTTLGLLSDSGALSSKLLICYLHALTSHCLPDPLTRRTGTEEALRLLGSAALRSFQHLDAKSADYLQAIADLSPQRAYYPDHLQVMETVQWNSSLLSLSQHDAFWQMAQAIHDHFKSFCEIFPDVTKEAVAPRLRGESSGLLVERARLRNAAFRVSEFGAEQNLSEYDHWYHSKDGRHLGPSKECNRASLVARCLDAGVQRSLFSPQGSIQDIIRQVTGESFSGTTKASLQVNLENLRPPLESIGEFWCNLHTSLAAEKNKYRIMFFLAFLLYATGAKWEIVQVLMVLSMPEPSTSVCPPAEPSFNLAITRATFKGDATKVVSRLAHRREECPEWRLPRNHGEKNRAYITRRHNLWYPESERLKSRFVDDLNTQLNGAWILQTPAGEPYGSYMDVASIMQFVQDLARTAKRSHDFFSYLNDVAAILRQTDLMPAQDRTKISETRPLPTDKLPDLSKRFISASSLFSCPAPSFGRPKLAHCVAQHSAESPGKAMQDQARPVSSLLERLWKKASQNHQRAYIQELRGSAESIGVSSAVSAGTVSRVDPSPTAQTAKELANKIAAAIDKALTGGSVAREFCLAAGMYPRLSPVFTLGRLARAHWGSLSREWQRCLVNYALSLVYLQRAKRLASFIGNPNRKRELQRELANLGSHDEFDPLNHPEGLLLELEQGILIRPVQQKIAATMTTPPGGKGAVMQLNMGEGKSSVIVPLVASALADGSRVVRAVVAKPQSKQMMHTLIAKLGGLINRRVFYLPFSRSIRLSPDQVESVRAMIQACQQEGGVLLVQPEHLLSFKLMGIEKIWHEAQQNPTMGGDILQLYQEFEAVSRDIVDESDENFSVKFELIYTMGSQQPVEMSPERWILIEAVMELLRDVVKRLARSKSGGGDLEGLLFEERQDKSGGFPTIRVLEDAAGQNLVETLAHQICALGLPGFPIHNVTASVRRAILAYMLKENLSQDEISSVEKADNGFFGENKTKQGLLLLRGLLAKGILLFALGQKRYRVNYGLAPDRRPPTMLAVPFRAKDMPSPRSEFSHPDVVIVLTCLSYYYRGLADDELFTSLELLSKSDLADQEYGIWASAALALPPTLRHFSGVNLKDQDRCRQSLFPALRYVKPAVDFYLSKVVFAKEMKEFPSKLSASGWDLAKPKTHPLTGFSGTIDSKRVLPLAVKALDLPDQRYTNAAVLDCLLRNENEVLELGGGPSQLSVLDTLLDAVTKKGMRVILDVGAQIIECSNAQLAKHWLESAPASETDAVIYFEDNDDLSVLTPCMRMRKLGHGQSVTFCVSQEMQKRIRTTCSVDPSHSIAVVDVLEWAISETWEEEVRSIPLWENQGIRHLYQETIWDRVARQKNFSQRDAQDYAEPETRTLEHRYRPISAAMQPPGPPTLLEKLTAALGPSDIGKQHLGFIKQKAEGFKLVSAAQSANFQEEQERELALEIEQERQIERPPQMAPVPHGLHDDVIHFACTGELRLASAAFIPSFQALEKSSAVQYFPPGVSNFPSDLLITIDYARTVDERGQGFCSDMYQRPVQWVLTSKSHMVVISQWEANKLKQLGPWSGPAMLRAYLPRPSLTFRTLEDLQIYTVPATASDEVRPELIMQLNLFAGQLYLRSYQHYVALCRYLGLSYTENRGDEEIAADGFVRRKEGEYAGCRFETSPIMFLNVLIQKLRRDRMGIEKTHMGKILAGEILTEKDFPKEEA
ncbi:hypothetical protein B0T26DRAFT_811927 [Lasiosphaeria miniovina]|uniref:ubiquitinyl hydrolase 1 n=1 Tax=Lasiosphaeria miniovina TaxID=1954250 RepID=A0AA40AX48_9PEZI|nr:uncharacterized protein B0T26DRAFT_811927 [Lasiosphaeria miniovina]KAK0723613.1 hypothetical protein B0T26DRAFT_811927 [Lasiosphaeria miniovina]